MQLCADRDFAPLICITQIVLVYAPFIVVFTLLKEAPTLVLARKSFFLAVRASIPFFPTFILQAPFRHSVR